MSFDETTAAKLFPDMAASAAPAKLGEAGKTDAERASKMFTGPTKYVSPWDKQQAAQAVEQPKAPQAPQQQQAEQQQPVMPEALGLDAANPLAGDAAKVFGELGIRDKAAVEKLTALQAKHEEQQWQARSAEWTKASMKEFDKTELANARTILAEFGDDELKRVLNETGVGSHPAVIRAFVKMARMVQASR